MPRLADVVAVLFSDWQELLRQAWPTTYATLLGFLLSAAFGIPVAMLIAGQPRACAGVGAAKFRSNHARVSGRKASSGSTYRD